MTGVVKQSHSAPLQIVAKLPDGAPHLLARHVFAQGNLKPQPFQGGRNIIRIVDGIAKTGTFIISIANHQGDAPFRSCFIFVAHHSHRPVGMNV